MFWNKSPKLPVTTEDKDWVEEYLLHLKDNPAEEHFLSLETILPTKEFYNITFFATEEDAHFVLEQTKIYMAIEHDNIKLQSFSDQPVTMADGTILSTPADRNGSWQSAAGKYHVNDETIFISIERKLLTDPQALIATIAHELSHYILLGEKRIEENDEYLTDLLAIIYGFGIMMGNTRFLFSATRDIKMSGWEMSSSGYLPEQIIAYTIAWLCNYKTEEPIWKEMLNPTMLKYFNQSVAYIKKYPEMIRVEL